MQKTIEEDSSSLVPVILALLAAQQAQQAEPGQPLLTAAVIASRAGGILTRIALRAATSQISRARSQQEEVGLFQAVDKAVDKAVEDASQILAKVLRPSRSNAAANAPATATTTTTTTSLPGIPFQDSFQSSPGPALPSLQDQAPPQAQAQALARLTAQTARNSAVYHLAEQTGEEMEDDKGRSYRYRATWHSMKDSRVRGTHAFLGSPSYEYHTVDIGEPFVTIAGNKLLFPGDPTAPPEETRGCRCWLTIARHYS